MRRVALAAAGVLTAFLLARFPYLPETIPTHFSFTGEPDDWGPRWMLFPLIVVFGGLAIAVAWLSKRPQFFNYPMEITDSNAQSAYREGERMMVWTEVALVVLYAGASASTIGWNGTAFVAVGIVGVLGAVIGGSVRLLAVD